MMSLTGSMLSLTDLRCFLIKHIIFRQKKYMQYYLAPVNEGYIYIYIWPVGNVREMMQSDKELRLNLMHGTTLAFVSKDVGENNRRQHAPDGSTANNEHHWCWECVREMCFSCSLVCFPESILAPPIADRGRSLKTSPRPPNFRDKSFSCIICLFAPMK